MMNGVRKFGIPPDRTRLEARLRWSAYRSLDLFGAAGLAAIAVLLAALGAELAMVRPRLAQQQEALQRIAGQRQAHGGIAAGVGVGAGVGGAAGAAAIVQRDADLPQMLALIERHGLRAHEVKYRRIAEKSTGKGAGRSAHGGPGKAAGAEGTRGARIAMALPASGSYAQFQELMAGLQAFRGVRAESFTLRRNLPTERMLAIDLNLSLPAPSAAAEIASGAGGSPGGADASERSDAADLPAYRDLFPEQRSRRALEDAAPPGSPPPPPKPQAPPLPFRLAGVWADEARRKFILSSGGADGRSVIACRRCGGRSGRNGDGETRPGDGEIGPGDRLFGDYRLQTIEPERLTFMYLPLSTTQAIVIDGAMRANEK